MWWGGGGGVDDFWVWGEEKLSLLRSRKYVVERERERERERDM